MLGIEKEGTVPIGKTRNPFAIVFLSIITFSIYYFVWYYKINKEIKLHDPNQRVRPGLAVLAQFFPIINLISAYNTAVRIRRMQMADNSSHLISPGWALFWFLFFFGIGYIFTIQGRLNDHWYEHQLKARQGEVPPA